MRAILSSLNLSRFSAKLSLAPENHLAPGNLRRSSTTVSNFFEDMIPAYAGIIFSKKFEAVVDDLSRFPGANWFSGARLNFAENLLRFRDDRIALISRSEGRGRSSLTYSDLYRKVARVANGLREAGVRPSDRVGGYLPNIEEAAIAMLAATSIGAVWACCGAELGSGAVLDRLGQVEPKVLFAADGYIYKGKKFNILPNVQKVVDGVPSLKKVVLTSHIGLEPKNGDLSRA